MGTSSSKLCNCFSSDETDSAKQLITYAESEAFHSVLPPIPPKLGHNADQLAGSRYEQLAETIREKFLEKILHPSLEGYVLMLEKDNIRVMTKDTSDGFLIWSEYRIPFRPHQFLSFISKTEKRKLWDSNVAEVTKVCQANVSTYVTYTIYKRFLTISSRDLLLLNTQGQHDNSLFEAYSSVEVDEFPVNKSHIRARMLLGGYYITPLSDDPDGNLSKIVSFSESSLGGSLPLSMVKKLSATAVPKFVQSMCEACRKDVAQS